MKNVLLVLGLLMPLFLSAQSVGDTIVVRSWDYSMTNDGSGNRDLMVDFPTDPNLKFEKIIMRYNMRCKDGLVSPPVSGQTNLGCGEWDYSCNTYVHDNSRADSIQSVRSSHDISDWSGTTFDYTDVPVANYQRYEQPLATVNAIINETEAAIGSANATTAEAIGVGPVNSKTQYLYTAAELSAAGLTAGDIDGLQLNATNANGTARLLKVKMKPTTASTLNAGQVNSDNFTEVYFHNTAFQNAANRLQFSTPFAWDGTSNILVEFTHSSTVQSSVLQEFEATTINERGASSTNDYYPLFTGSNFVTVDGYNGIAGNQARTVEAWINTSITGREIVGWGVNATEKKWSIRVNGDGTLRVEVAGGFKFGTTRIDDGQWHHVAVVLSSSDIGNALLFVDGAQESTGGVSGINVDTDGTGAFTIGTGRNNSFFEGAIDEVRVWRQAVNSTTIAEWAAQKVTADHPDYANLDVYFNFDDADGMSATDLSANNRTGTFNTLTNRVAPRGEALFKGFAPTTTRLDATFLQGEYDLTVITDQVFDTLGILPNIVTEYGIFPNFGTTRNDSVGVLSSTQLWQAGGFSYFFDESGAAYDSVAVAATGSITPTDLNFVARSPMKFEIMSFVTPYGINLDLGPEGKTWAFDVTDFSNVLRGTKRMTMERGGERQEDMDIQFLFIVGTPTRDVIDLENIWRVEMQNINTISSNTRYEPRTLTLHPDGASYQVKSAITGHGQQGEFIPQSHVMNINGGTEEFVWQVWKECAENPVFPQGGTWIFDRAGWCPGMATDVQVSEITDFVSPGDQVEFDYGVRNGSGDTRYISSHQLVTYGPMNFNTDATLLNILNPTNNVEFEKISTACKSPEILVQNTGSERISTLRIEYWVNDAVVPRVLEWEGSILPLAQERIILAATERLWADLQDGENKFHARIVTVNGSADEYENNDRYTTSFGIPAVLPSEFEIRFRTNGFSAESSYEIRDDQGDRVFFKGSMFNNRVYQDTLRLNPGCYTLRVNDADDDGLDFFANNDGVGYCRIYRTDSPVIIETLEPDFGRFIEYHFTVDFALAVDESEAPETQMTVFPNPAGDHFVVRGEKLADYQLTLLNSIGQPVGARQFPSGNEVLFDTNHLPAGIFLLHATDGVNTFVEKVVIE